MYAKKLISKGELSEKGEDYAVDLLRWFSAPLPAGSYIR